MKAWNKFNKEIQKIINFFHSLKHQKSNKIIKRMSLFKMNNSVNLLILIMKICQNLHLQQN